MADGGMTTSRRLDPLTPVWKPGSLKGPYFVAEAIAARDRNNLYRTSCHFRERERYEAFCAMYAVMRILDDRVDHVVASTSLSSEARLREADVLQAWHIVVSECQSGKAPSPSAWGATKHPAAEQLAMALQSAMIRFPVPTSLWHDFFASMQQDLVRDRFVTFAEFVDYAKGATVAPTTLYLDFIVAEPNYDGSVYLPPQEFDLAGCGHNLGLFAYIAHILRDLPDDLMAGEHGLLYLAADDMAAHGVTEAILRRDLSQKTTSPPVRALARVLAGRAKRLAYRGRLGLRSLRGNLTPDRAFVLELIVRLYEEQLKQIADCSYQLMSGVQKLSDAHKERIVRELAIEMKANEFSREALA